MAIDLLASATRLARSLEGSARSRLRRLARGSGGAYECPICRYRGPFTNIVRSTGFRKHAECPRCGSLERHRLQWLALERALAGRDPRGMRMLHFAPEPFFAGRFRARFGTYVSADLVGDGVDRQADITALPFADGSLDVVFASHVLEHVLDEGRALREVRRVLAAGGLAVLPVPILGVRTVEYGTPNAHEHGHVRAPGEDYFDRLRAVFDRVDVLASEDVAAEYQTYTYEDRSRWPETMPLRPTAAGERHRDFVPVGWVRARGADG